LAQIKNKFIQNDAVSGSKIRLGNNESLRARNVGDSADVELMKLDTSDILQFLTHPQITSSASGDNDVLTLKDLNAELEGLKPKEACRVATTANITLSGLQAIDGVVVSAGDRVLVKDQTLASQNGIYVADGSGWTRSEDMDATSPINEVNGAYTFIQEGTDNEGKGFVQQGTVTTIGIDPINFVFFNSAADLVGGDGIDITGVTVSVDHDGEGLTFNGDQLSIELDGASLSKSVDGLEIADGGVSEAKLGSDVDAESLQIATGYTPGAGTVLVGDTVQAALEKVDGNAAAAQADATQAISDAAAAQSTADGKQDPISGADAIDVTADVVSLTLSQGETAIGITSDAGTVDISAAGTTLSITDTNSTSVSDSPSVTPGNQYQITDNSGAVWKFTPAFVTNIGVGILDLAASSDITKDDVSKVSFAEFTTRSSVADASVGLARIGSDSYLDQTDGLKAVVAADYASAVAGELMDAQDIKDAISAATPTTNRETITLNGTDISNGYIDLAATPAANSVVFVVDGAPAQLEGVDWSVSTNRITFLGDLASGGDAALESGDVIQVTYL